VERASHRERVAILSAFAGTLTPRQQALVVLHYRADWPLAAVAAAFGVSEPAVSQMHVRILKLFKVHLSGLHIVRSRDI
jgi:predicted DNA-binding protein YlxM (UPF0122 family)